jgi:hypothetical protein
MGCERASERSPAGVNMGRNRWSMLCCRAVCSSIATLAGVNQFALLTCIFVKKALTDLLAFLMQRGAACEGQLAAEASFELRLQLQSFEVV